MRQQVYSVNRPLDSTVNVHTPSKMINTLLIAAAKWKESGTSCAKGNTHCSRFDTYCLPEPRVCSITTFINLHEPTIYIFRHPKIQDPCPLQSHWRATQYNGLVPAEVNQSNMPTVPIGRPKRRTSFLVSAPIKIIYLRRKGDHMPRGIGCRANRPKKIQHGTCRQSTLINTDKDKEISRSAPLTDLSVAYNCWMANMGTSLRRYLLNSMPIYTS